MSYLVLDIETITDTTIWSPTPQATTAANLIDGIEPKVEFPPVFAQKPISIGCALFDDSLNCTRLGCIGGGNLFNNELELLSQWSTYMQAKQPCLVTWNGRSFDLPVLNLRCFKYGISNQWYFDNKNYRYRYSENCHLDLMDAMGDYGAAGRNGFRLDALAKVIGLPGKYGVDGSAVQEMHDMGKNAAIDTYCLTDVIQTSFLLLRWLLIKGQLDLPTYQAKSTQFFSLVKEETRFAEFCSLVNQPALTLLAPT